MSNVDKTSTIPASILNACQVTRPRFPAAPLMRRKNDVYPNRDRVAALRMCETSCGSKIPRRSLDSKAPNWKQAGTRLIHPGVYFESLLTWHLAGPMPPVQIDRAPAPDCARTRRGNYKQRNRLQAWAGGRYHQGSAQPNLPQARHRQPNCACGDGPQALVLGIEWRLLGSRSRPPCQCCPGLMRRYIRRRLAAGAAASGAFSLKFSLNP
jgi:hypothetical protein